MIANCVVRKDQVILSLGLEGCVMNEVFDSEVFVLFKQRQGGSIQLLGSLCRSSVYVEYDDDDREKERTLTSYTLSVLVEMSGRWLMSALVCLRMCQTIADP